MFSLVASIYCSSSSSRKASAPSSIFLISLFPCSFDCRQWLSPLLFAYTHTWLYARSELSLPLNSIVCIDFFSAAVCLSIRIMNRSPFFVQFGTLLTRSLSVWSLTTERMFFQPVSPLSLPNWMKRPRVNDCPFVPLCFGVSHSHSHSQSKTERADRKSWTLLFNRQDQEFLRCSHLHCWFLLFLLLLLLFQLIYCRKQLASLVSSSCQSHLLFFSFPYAGHWLFFGNVFTMFFLHF